LTPNAVFQKPIKHWGVPSRGVSHVPRRATIANHNALDVGIETTERRRVPLVTAESRSAATILINTTTFMHNAG
jgi:hypothetical protein